MPLSQMSHTRSLLLLAVTFVALTAPTPGARATARAAATIVRTEGSTPYETAALTMLELFPAGSGTVVIGSGDPRSFVHGQLGTVLAGISNCPLLFTGTDSLDPYTAAAITSLGATEALIVGGQDVVGPSVQASLTAMGLSVSRYGGADLLEDSARVAVAARDLDRGIYEGIAYLIHAEPTPDWRALYAVAPMCYNGRPILFTGYSTVPTVTMQAIAEADVTTVLVVGSESYISEAVLDRLRDEGLNVRRIVETSRKGLAAAHAEFALAGG